mgnify:CR=1 FL=1|jgi:hypothetical protein
MNKGGRAAAMVSKPVEGPKNAPMPQGGKVEFGYTPAGRKGKKA